MAKRTRAKVNAGTINHIANGMSAKLNAGSIGIIWLYRQAKTLVGGKDVAINDHSECETDKHERLKPL